MITILKRPPHDSFTYRLFFKFASKMTAPCDCIYLWSAALDPHYFNPSVKHYQGEFFKYETELHFRNCMFELIKEDVIVLGIKDHLTSTNFDPWTEDKPSLVKYLDEMFTFYSDKKFILLTSLENLGVYLTNSNVTIVPWGGDLTNQQSEYKLLQPVIEKNMASQHSYISLNRNIRTHRLGLMAILHGLNLEQYGNISCMFKDSLSPIYWTMTEQQAHIQQVMEHGYAKLASATFSIQDDVQIYANGDNDNVTNFKNKLSSYYANSFVEIVSETSFTERAFLITEKTLNSIYGCNFPIILCGPGSVKFLRDMGLDMFDDVVNHNYDTMDNPVDRLYHAIYDNIDLLTDIESTKSLWQANKHRFLSNVDFVKNKIYKFYTERATAAFDKAILE